ncbi:MAG: RNA polymerase sigma factor [Myxococcaceae bacterium]|nr:RNA polymerase sigma factor [Myxococcaceae bacterium]
MTELSPYDEAALLAQARSSSATEREQAFNALFTATRRDVYALCLHLCGNRSDAEDAVQECFVGVHQALPRFRGESRLSTWVYRIALRSAWQVRARHPRGREDLEQGLGKPSDAPAPDDVASARQQTRQIHAAMQKLSEEHRTVLSLFAIDGLGHKQVADVLGIAEGTVWSRLHSARKRLAAELLQAPAVAC